MSKNNDDGNESPESEVTGCGLPDFTHTPRKTVRTRSVALRAPTLELKAVWQNLIQRQIIYLNTKARGRTPGSSPSDTPDSPSEQVNLMQELIENRCRQLCRRKSSVKKGSALHLSDWLKGRLGGNINTEPPSPEEEIETWSREALHERMWKLSKSGKREIHPRNESRMEDLELSEYSRSASRCTMNSQVIETVTKSPDRTMPVCRKCHKTCLLLPCNSNENNRNTSMSAAKQHLESTDFNANPIFDETNGNYDQLSPSDPFKPLPDIAVHPPSPPKRTQSQETEDDSEEEEDLPYQVLPPSSSSNLKRYGTMSSLEKLDDEPLESLETNEPAVSGQLESVSTYLGGWTSRAGSYVADKMSFFEKFGQDSFLDKYLNRTSQELPATSTNLAFDDEVETASGASGEELWGTPTSGPDFEMTSPLPESPSSGKDEYGETEKMSNIPPNAILSNVRNETGGRFFATRTRLDPLPEDEEDVSTTTSSSSPDTSACTQSCPTQQSARDSRLGAFNTSPGFFHRLKLRRSQSADSQPKPCNKLLEFLSSRRSANGRRRLTRLFSRESFSDDILTSLPQSPHTKGNDRRFWKQFRRKKHPNN